jgi:hypothetical protein
MADLRASEGGSCGDVDDGVGEQRQRWDDLDPGDVGAERPISPRMRPLRSLDPGGGCVERWIRPTRARCAIRRATQAERVHQRMDPSRVRRGRAPATVDRRSHGG